MTLMSLASGFLLERTRLPLLEGMPDSIYVSVRTGELWVKGSIHVSYADGTEETVNAGEVYYWPPGHTVRVDEDYEAIEFSPAGAMGETYDSP